MKLSTVKLKHNRKNRTIKVNEYDFANDLGAHKYRDYTLLAVRGSPDKKEDVNIAGETVTLTQEQAQKDNADIPREERDNLRKKGSARKKRVAAKRRKSSAEVTDKEEK